MVISLTCNYSGQIVHIHTHTHSRAVCSLYPTINLWQLSFSSHRHSDLEQSSAAHRIRAITTRLLHSFEDILLRTMLFIILLLCLRSDIDILDTLIVFTYLLTYVPQSSSSIIC